MNKNNILFKKTLVTAIFVFLICISISQSIAISNLSISYEINSDRKILYVGGTGENNYTTIQDAIYNASSGDTIFVYDDSSPYIENVRIFKSINLVGEDKNTTIIDGSGVGNVLFILTDEINIESFTITNANCGILVNSHYNTFKNLIIKNNIDGMKFGRTNNHIENNFIFDNVLGINLEDSHNNTIDNNIISENIGALLVSKCNDNEINSNKISKNNGGIILFESTNTTIYSNNISQNNYGIYIKGSKDNTIISNDIISNYRYGIWLYNSSLNKIILNNNISKNNIGIKLKNSCFSNHIYKNNFLNNTENAIDECNNIWDNEKYGNYWSDYTEKYPEAKKKIMKPWMWDTPYKIDGGKNYDNCPLTKYWTKTRIIPYTERNIIKSIDYHFGTYLKFLLNFVINFYN
jgi:parallel beta-helix repeat protein